MRRKSERITMHLCSNKMRDIYQNSAVLKNYYHLTKPGIIYGNAITVAGGFFLASKGYIDLRLFLAALAGISFIIASGCVFNNYIDRKIDAKMARTKNRALANGAISVQRAITFAIMLGMLGIFVLGTFTNLLALCAALAGAFFYIVVYSLWTKRRSVYGTLVGSISGAVPPVVGYVAVVNGLDLGALILFLILALWQMPHSYAIAIYRLPDYKDAGIPVLPAIRGIQRTKWEILMYTGLFVAATTMLFVFGYVGAFYLVVMSTLGLSWLFLSLRGFGVKDDKKWARGMFLFSLVIIILFSFLISAPTRLL